MRAREQRRDPVLSGQRGHSLGELLGERQPAVMQAISEHQGVCQICDVFSNTVAS